MRDDTSAGIHFDYKDAPPAPVPPAGAPQGGAPPQGEAPAPVQKGMPPTMTDILKNQSHGHKPLVPGAVITTALNELPPLTMLDNPQLSLRSRRSGGKSPDKKNRAFGGSTRHTQTHGDARDFKSVEEVNADAKIKDMDDRLGLD